ncbi:MAG: WYL domain-containing protein [Cyanobacteria bacterium RUI128]|nr:WYL domain-containing protein [Cyanobacteria bacterium RUI128]
MDNTIAKYRDENKQISLTGARVLVMLAALMESPKNFEEIRDFMIECNVMDKEYSVDTVRIDINTLKAIGCEISKATKRNNHKYALKSHPFRLNTNTAEINALQKVYDKMLKTMQADKILLFHELLLKIASLVDDETLKEQIIGISVLKQENIPTLKDLIEKCKKHNRVTLEYQTPYSDSQVYDITIEKLGIRNRKLYVYCYNHSTEKRMFLNASRIKAVVNSLFNRDLVFLNDKRVKYSLKNYSNYVLEDNEVILEHNGDTAVIEGRYFNEFIAIQRVLSFAGACTVIEPDNFKALIIKKLKEMRSVYE